jgi:tRNA/tmRNA/rRNA uracil-C5-methylase (TrmA/RlmC/RlmD family)
MAAGSNDIVGTDTCLLGAGALASSAAVATQAVANTILAQGAKVEVEVTLDAHGALHTRLLENRRGFEPRRQGNAAPHPGRNAQKTPPATRPHFELPHPRLAPFLVHPESFVQPHTDAAKLYGETLEAALVSFLGRTPPTPEGAALRMWDLYCGSGAFSFVPFFLAPEQRASRAFNVVAVEGVGHAVESCVLNHAQNQNRFEPGAEAGFRAVAGDVAAFVRHARALEAPHVVIADPPRDGMGTASLQQLVTLFDASPQEPRLFLYVACDSGSLARDMKPLLLGGFKLEALHVFHTFAQSAHFETIAVLTRGVAP